MPKAIRTESAERDFENIGFQIAVVDGRTEVADRILRDLAAQCDRLARLSSTSQLGTAAPEVGKDVRLFSHKRWVIIFRYTDDGITVLRLADASQDYLSWKLSPLLHDR